MNDTIEVRLNGIIDELLTAGITLEQATVVFEEKMISRALDRTKRVTARRRGGRAAWPNVTQAAKLLGVHRNTLHNKLRTRYGIAR